MDTPFARGGASQGLITVGYQIIFITGVAKRFQDQDQTAFDAYVRDCQTLLHLFASLNFNSSVTNDFYLEVVTFLRVLLYPSSLSALVFDSGKTLPNLTLQPNIKVPLNNFHLIGHIITFLPKVSIIRLKSPIL